MKTAIATVLTLTFASAAFANGNSTGTTQPPASGTRDTPSPAIAPIGHSINPGAIAGQQSQSGGAAINAQVGTALMATGARLMSHKSTRVRGTIIMAMGVLAMRQSSHDSGAAFDSGITGDYSDTGGGGPSTNPASNPGNGSGSGGFVNDKIKEGEAALKEAGFSLTDKGLKGPDGSFIPAKAFDSASSMAAAGIDSGTISAAQSALQAATAGAGAGAGGVSDAPKVSSVDVNTAGGGGGGAYQGDAGGEEGLSGLPNPFAMNSEKKAALVAGKTVNYDGEPIGVRGQNIFDMVHSRYQKKRARNNFIETEYIVNNRLPASVKPRSK